MDLGNSCQDVIRCDLCEGPMPPLHCDVCHVDLCKACVVDHITDFSKEHRVVPFSERGAMPVYPKCSTHNGKACEVQCTQCDTPVCSLCVTDKHKGHTFWSILKSFTAQKEEMKKDLEELVNVLSTKYESKASEIESEKSSLEGKYEELMTTIDKEAAKLHKEIDMLVKRRQTEVNDMKMRHMADLNKEKEKITSLISEIQQSIQHLNEVSDSNEVCVVFAYKSKNAQFRKFPPRVHFSLPKISSQEINTEKLYKMFGHLSPLSILCEESSCKHESSDRYSEDLTLIKREISPETVEGNMQRSEELGHLRQSYPFIEREVERASDREEENVQRSVKRYAYPGKRKTKRI